MSDESQSAVRPEEFPGMRSSSFAAGVFSPARRPYRWRASSNARRSDDLETAPVWSEAHGSSHDLGRRTLGGVRRSRRRALRPEYGSKGRSTVARVDQVNHYAFGPDGGYMILHRRVQGQIGWFGRRRRAPCDFRCRRTHGPNGRETETGGVHSTKCTGQRCLLRTARAH